MSEPILVVYATREGHTRTVAEHVAATLRARGRAVDVLDAAHVPPEGLELAGRPGVVLAASVHLGRHEREMVAFVKAHREELDRVPTAFLSVSLSEAGVENRAAPFDARARAAEDVRRLVDEFCHETGLHPSRVWPVAGALMYRRYGVFTRLVMKTIARRAGADTDTSRDHELTDWAALDRFVAVLAEEMDRPEAPAAQRNA